MNKTDLLFWFFVNDAIMFSVFMLFTDLKVENMVEYIRKSKEQHKGNRDRIHALWEKHNRLLKHLKLEDVTMPQERVIRKAKVTKARHGR